MSDSAVSHNHVVKASEVVGVSVKNTAHDNLGEINDIVIDKIQGNIKYMVLDFGGFMSFGNKFFAVPWHLFQYDNDHGHFVLNIEKDRLKNAPGFDKNNWPNFASPDVTSSIDKFYRAD